MAGAISAASENILLQSTFKIMNFFGAWNFEENKNDPAQSLNDYRRNYTRFWGTCSVFICTLCLVMADFIQIVNVNVLAAFKNICVFLQIFTKFYVLITLFVERKEISPLVKNICSYYKVTDKTLPAEREVLENGVKYARKTMIMQSLLHFSIVSAYSSFAILDSYENRNKPDFDKQLPFRMYFPLNINQWRNYMIAYSLQFCIGPFITSTIASTEFFQLRLILHPIIQLRILKIKLENLFEVMDPKIIREKFRECINRHRDIMAYIDLFNQTQSTIFFISLMLNTFLICVTLFEVAVLGGHGKEVITFGVYLFGLCAELLFFYWHGTLVTFECSEVATAVWNSKWYQAIDDKSQISDIKYLICRTQKPVFMTVGVFFNLTLETYVSIMKTAYSLFALIEQQV